MACRRQTECHSRVCGTPDTHQCSLLHWQEAGLSRATETVRGSKNKLYVDEKEGDTRGSFESKHSHPSPLFLITHSTLISRCDYVLTHVITILVNGLNPGGVGWGGGGGGVQPPMGVLQSLPEPHLLIPPTTTCTRASERRKCGQFETTRSPLAHTHCFNVFRGTSPLVNNNRGNMKEDFVQILLTLFYIYPSTLLFTFITISG